MADTKITALSALTAADPANDVLPIVDVNDPFMAASGTTKKISINNILGASGTATLASATISGDLTVDTSTLKVDSANNRVGIGTASPAKRCEINQSANAFTTIGEGEILRLIGDDGNTVGRITEIGFGTGPTGAVYAPVTLGAINTSITGYNHKAFYIATRTGTSDIAPVERYRIANDGVATWSNVGGGAGTAMTLNSTGLGVGSSPQAKLHVSNGATIDSGLFTGLMIGASVAGSARSASIIKDTSTPYNLIIRTQDFTGGTTGSLVVQNGSTEVLRVNSNAAVILAGGSLTANGVGITFPATQVASSDANTLDDYEEGTWTGTLAGATTNPTTPVTATGRYTKIGRQVSIQIQFTNVDTTGASGQIKVTGAPFTNNSSVSSTGAVLLSSIGTFTGSPTAFIGVSTTEIELYSSSSGGAAGLVTHNAGASRSLYINLTYTV